MTAADRAIELLERELETAETEEERRDILRAIRDIQAEEGERERWEDEGRDRGWF